MKVQEHVLMILALWYTSSYRKSSELNYGTQTQSSELLMPCWNYANPESTAWVYREFNAEI